MPKRHQTEPKLVIAHTRLPGYPQFANWKGPSTVSWMDLRGTQRLRGDPRTVRPEGTIGTPHASMTTNNEGWPAGCRTTRRVVEVRCRR